MSYTVSPQDPSWDLLPEQPVSRPMRLLAVVAGAMLFLLGILLGGLMGRAPVAVDTGHSADELAALRAEIGQLNLQFLQERSRTLELERELANQQAVTVAPSNLDVDRGQLQRVLGRAIESVEANRQVCLNELLQFQQHSMNVPTDQVIRFAETLFKTQTLILNGLSHHQSGNSTLLDLQTELITAVSATTAEAQRAKRVVRPASAASPVAMTALSQPGTGAGARRRESVPTLAEAPLPKTTLAVESPRQGVFFTAPQARRQGVSFFTPQLPSRVASQQRSGISFTDTGDSETGPTLR